MKKLETYQGRMPWARPRGPDEEWLEPAPELPAGEPVKKPPLDWGAAAAVAAFVLLLAWVVVRWLFD